MSSNEGKFGFGLMRLPRRGVKIDVDQVSQMVDLFLDAGFTYEILGNARDIPCTACRYRVEGCPRHILIPDMFAAMNKQLVGGQLDEARADYRAAVDAGNFASACIACGRCEDVCPQNIEIISQLRACVTALE